MCRTYGCRPSEALGIPYPEVALDFDLAMAAIHRAEARSRVSTTVAQAEAAGGAAGTLQALFELI